MMQMSHAPAIAALHETMSRIADALNQPGIERGRARKSKDGKPEFVEGSAAKPAVFEPDKIANEQRLWWEAGSGDKFHYRAR